MERSSGSSLPFSDLVPAAGGGLLDRRLFLKRGLLLPGVGALTWSADPARAEDDAVLPWMRVPGRPFSNYGQPSQGNRIKMLMPLSLTS
jgi:sulfane dehydrogenase subunit SoxC